MPSAVVRPEMEETKLSLPLEKKNSSIWDLFARQASNVFGDIYYLIFMGVILLLSLFLADSWVLGNAPDADNAALYSILIAIFVIFSVELLVMSLTEKGYFLSFLFWLDLLGTFSIIIDIAWIAEKFIPDSNNVSQGSVVRSTRAARLASRYGRLLRLMRIMRVFKTFPCFKFFGVREDFEPTMAAIKKVSEELSNTLQLRLAVLILTLVIVIPFMSYSITDFSPNAWITNFKITARNQTVTDFDVYNMIRKCEHFYWPKDIDLKAISIESPWVEGNFYTTYYTREVVRDNNILVYDSSYYVANSILNSSSNAIALSYLANASSDGRDSKPDYTEFFVQLKLDNTDIAQKTAMFNILIIVLVIVMLFAFSSSFNSAVNNMVVKPLEKMMFTLRGSAVVMIKTLKSLENEGKEESKNGGENGEEDEEEEELETAKLEKMVEKLGRIVAHILPGNQDIAVDGNIDKSTAIWLKQSYAGGGTVRRNIEKTESVMAHEGDADRSLLRHLEENFSAEIMETVDSWHFDVLNHSEEELSDVIVYLFCTLNLLENFKVPESTFRLFLKSIFSRYIDNTYHNFRHGCDVCFTSYRLLVIPKLTAVFTSLEVFSLLVGALAHDVGHIGKNNAFLVKAKHELALRHNDKSPLENMHCVVLYEVLSYQETNIFRNLDESQWREARKIIIFIVLGTDMMNHPQQIKDTKLFLEVNGEATNAFCTGARDDIPCLAMEKERHAILELILHCSDISNPFKPYELCAKWADLVVEEFFQQGDTERSMGLEISPMCDRNAVNLCNMQMGFIEFAVAPLITTFVKIFPPLHDICSNMLNNHSSWAERRKIEVMGDDTIHNKHEECRKLDDRISKFRDSMSFVSALKELPVRRGSV
jgi:cAMP-specific phosphodiesterase 4